MVQKRVCYGFAPKAEENVVKRELGFLMLQMGKSELIDEALTFLGPLSYKTTNEFVSSFLYFNLSFTFGLPTVRFADFELVELPEV